VPRRICNHVHQAASRSIFCYSYLRDESENISELVRRSGGDYRLSGAAILTRRESETPIAGGLRATRRRLYNATNQRSRAV
jgi:hypothetical protein